MCESFVLIVSMASRTRVPVVARPDVHPSLPAMAFEKSMEHLRV